MWDTSLRLSSDRWALNGSNATVSKRPLLAAWRTTRFHLKGRSEYHEELLRWNRGVCDSAMHSQICWPVRVLSGVLALSRKHETKCLEITRWEGLHCRTISAQQQIFKRDAKKWHNVNIYLNPWKVWQLQTNKHGQKDGQNYAEMKLYVRRHPFSYSLKCNLD